MQKACRTLSQTVLALLILASLSGCSQFQFPGVYRLEVQQGNIITQEMVDQLKPGMTKRQVRYILGTPVLADTGNQSRGDYFYSLRDARSNTEKERISVFFKDEKLTHFSGDFTPTPAVADDSAI